MRILAIRGANLASLEGAFALELNRPPLGDAGLFAITGPTGAGKSTILDAACVALYNRTPRLDNHGGVGIGVGEDPESDRLKSNDPRSLLRHGTAEGYAEVDFLGVDGLSYQARWSVRRARGHSRGRMQDEQLSLVDLRTGRSLGSTKGEVQREIEQKLGLSYEQFVRSVLLAQGEFAQFLKAKPDDRAALLEKLTGTALYSRISQKAFERAKAAKGDLQLVEHERARLRILGPEERVEREAEAKELEQTQKELKETKSTADKAVQWYGELARRTSWVEETELEFGAADERWKAADRARDAFERVVSAQGLRGPLENFDARTGEVEAAGARLADLTGEVLELRAGLMTQKDASEKARELRSGAEAALQALGPELEKARALDVQIEGAGKAAAEAHEQRERAEQAASGAEAAAQTVADKVTGLSAVLEKATEWFANNEGRRSLAEGWTHWGHELAVFDETSKAFEEAVKRVRRQEDLVSAARTSAGAAKAKRDRAFALLDTAKVEHLHLAKLVAEIDAEAMRTERKALTEARNLTKDVVQIAQAAKQAAEAEKEAGEDRIGTEAAAEESRKNAKKARGKLAGLERELKEARSQLQEIEAARSLEDHRKELKPGRPCPLCGSLEHPRADDTPTSAGSVARQRARVTKLENECRELRDAISSGAADAKSSTAESRKAAARAGKQQRQLASLLKSWTSSRPKLIRAAVAAGLLASAAKGAMIAASPLEPKVLTALKGLLKQAEDRLKQLAVRETELNRRMKTRDKMQDTVDTRREVFSSAEDGRLGAERKLSEATNEQKTLAERRDSQEKELGRRLGLLESVVGYREGWKDAIRISPAKFHRACLTDVEEWRLWITQSESAQVGLKAEEPRLAAAQAQALALGEAARVAGKAAAQRDGVLADLTMRRSGILNGRLAPDVEREHKEAVQRTADGFEELQKLILDLSGRLSTSEGEVKGAENHCAGAMKALAAADKELKTRLATAGIDLQILRGLLAHDEVWIEAERSRLNQLKDLVSKLRTVLDERRRNLDEHEKTGRPVWKKEEAEESLRAVEIDLQTAEEKAGTVRLALREDEEQRKLSAKLGEQIQELQGRADLWQSLNDLIGSADGKKFRVYVQSLTLDLLLFESNAYLKDLAPRYRIRRVPGSDMDLMVTDQDMGEEARSINSLSGGESFLASLALALGLSSLTARETQVGSLFIDEGFGSLDPQTLETALSVLDSLQATGRQIAVISHVSSLAEGIAYSVKVRPRGSGRSVVEVGGIGGSLGRGVRQGGA